MEKLDLYNIFDISMGKKLVRICFWNTLFEYGGIKYYKK